MDYVKLEENLNVQIDLFHDEYKTNREDRLKFNNDDILIKNWTVPGLVEESWDYRLKLIVARSLENVAVHMLNTLSASDTGDVDNCIFNSIKDIVEATKEEIVDARTFYKHYCNAFRTYKLKLSPSFQDGSKSKMLQEFEKIFASPLMSLS